VHGCMGAWVHGCVWVRVGACGCVWVRVGAGSGACATRAVLLDADGDGDLDVFAPCPTPMLALSPVAETCAGATFMKCVVDVARVLAFWCVVTWATLVVCAVCCGERWLRDRVNCGAVDSPAFVCCGVCVSRG
jgi:hypothetical protein